MMNVAVEIDGFVSVGLGVTVLIGNNVEDGTLIATVDTTDFSLDMFSKPHPTRIKDIINTNRMSF